MKIFIPIIILFILNSCQVKVKKIKNLYSENQIIATTISEFIKKLPSDSSIEIKTYDGSGQVVHPDVLWNKNELIMGITPYPYYIDSLENPCLYKSYDGVNFTDYMKDINPIVKKPIIDHNCDPDIFFNKKGELVIYYIEMLRPKLNNVIALTQKNKSSVFKKSTILNYNLKKNEPLIMSPSIMFNNKKNEYVLYFVNNDLKYNRIETIISKKDYNFKKENTKTPNIEFPKNYSPWHLDVIKGDDEKYYLLTTGYYGNPLNDNYSLYLAESKDLINWTNNHEILNKKNIPYKNLKYVYRSSALIADNKIAIWYSYTTKGATKDLTPTWHLALKKLNL